MKVIICGAREFSDYKFLEDKCLKIISREQYDQELPNSEIEIVSGHARGADEMGEKFSLKWLKKKAKLFPANWDDLETPPVYLKKNTFGEWMNALAGSNRNQAMAEYVTGNGGGICVGFIKGKSNGTKDMLRIARKLKIKVYKIDYDKEKKNEQKSN